MRRIVAAGLLAVAACTASPATPPSTADGFEASETARPATTSAGNQPTTSDPTAASPPLGNGSPAACWSADPATGTPDISFVDRTADLGLVDPLLGMHGHAAAWGDLDDDGYPDLVVGTFSDRPVERYQARGGVGPSPDTLLLSGSPYAIDRAFPPVRGRTSGAVIVDLDDDGDEDVVLSRNMRARERGDSPTQIYRNDGGRFALVDIDFGRLFGGRSVGVLDHDLDGLLDLLVLEDRFAGGRSSILLENLGDLSFRDATADAGIPAGLHGLGIATSDLNGDGRTDFFVAGSNRLFIASEDGFTEADPTGFQWEVFGDEDDASGASISDLNRDGLPDLVVGHHFNSTISNGALVPIRLYLNRGNDVDGMPILDDVTARAGLPGLPTKAPHVEIADFDNDGWPDILATASAENGAAPVVFRHLGLDPDGVPTFDSPAGLGDPQYWVSGPTADVDHDGRLDVFLVEWEPTLPSRLLLNESTSGNWLEVAPGGDAVGSVVRMWEAGHLAEPAHFLGMREIVVSQGYASGNLPVAHFGLGEIALVDLEVTHPDGNTLEMLQVDANQHLALAGCR